MATAYELDLMNDVEISPGFCPLCGDPWEACLCFLVDFYNEDDLADYWEEKSDISR